VEELQKQKTLLVGSQKTEGADGAPESAEQGDEGAEGLMVQGAEGLTPAISSRQPLNTPAPLKSQLLDGSGQAVTKTPHMPASLLFGTPKPEELDLSDISVQDLGLSTPQNHAPITSVPVSEIRSPEWLSNWQDRMNLRASGLRSSTPLKLSSHWLDSKTSGTPPRPWTGKPEKPRVEQTLDRARSVGGDEPSANSEPRDRPYSASIVLNSEATTPLWSQEPGV